MRHFWLGYVFFRLVEAAAVEMGDPVVCTLVLVRDISQYSLSLAPHVGSTLVSATNTPPL